MLIFLLRKKIEKDYSILIDLNKDYYQTIDNIFLCCSHGHKTFEEKINKLITNSKKQNVKTKVF